MMISIKLLTLITLVTIQSVNGEYKSVKKSDKSIAYIPLNIDDDGQIIEVFTSALLKTNPFEIPEECKLWSNGCTQC